LCNIFAENTTAKERAVRRRARPHRSLIENQLLLLDDGCVFGILDAVDVVFAFLFRLIAFA
jgi:hypothetical protein